MKLIPIRFVTIVTLTDVVCRYWFVVCRYKLYTYEILDFIFSDISPSPDYHSSTDLYPIEK